MRNLAYKSTNGTVAYRLTDGTVVSTLTDAKKSGQWYTPDLHTIKPQHPRKAVKKRY